MHDAPGAAALRLSRTKPETVPLYEFDSWASVQHIGGILLPRAGLVGFSCFKANKEEEKNEDDDSKIGNEVGCNL